MKQDEVRSHEKRHGYNTSMVNPSKLNSYRDFLDPKSKTTLLPRGQTLPFIWHVMGPDYMRQLAKKSFIPPNLRHALDLVVTGQMHICPFCTRDEARQTQKQGLPVANLTKGMKEGEQITVGGHTFIDESIGVRAGRAGKL